MSRAEYKKHHTADPDALKLVKAFGREFNLKVEADSNRGDPTHRATDRRGIRRSEGVRRGVEPEDHRRHGVSRPRGGIHLPESLGGSVLAVLGLDNRPRPNRIFA